MGRTLDACYKKAGELNARDGRGIRLARGLFLALRTRPRGPPRAPGLRGPEQTGQDPGIHRYLKGPEKARLEVRRPDHGLRLHAGHGPGQRPPGRLLLPRRGGGRKGEL